MIQHDERPLTMHAARTALNRNPDIRDWVEQWLKQKERVEFMKRADANDDDFERHWRYAKPERVHEGAVEAVAAYYREHQK